MAPAESPEVEELFDDLSVVAHSMTDDADLGDLLEAERELIAGAGAVRRHQFAAGRVCARAGLRHLGFEDQALLTGGDRQPLWPAGAFGSISHTRGYVVAVVAAVGDLAGRRFGVDAERGGRVHAGLYRHLFTEDERSRLARAVDSERLATAMFSAKEAFYKAQYPLTGAWIGFGDVSIELHGATGWARPASDRDVLRALRWPVPVSIASSGSVIIAGATAQLIRTA